MACKKAYRVLGQTKDQPRFFRSFDSATDAGEVVKVLSERWVMLAGRSPDVQ